MDWFLYDNGLRHERVNFDERLVLEKGMHFVLPFPKWTDNLLSMNRSQGVENS